MGLHSGLMWPLLAQGENIKGKMPKNYMLVKGLMSLNHSFIILYRMTVWLSTAPNEPLTHWYQVRCLLQTPLFAKMGQTLSGHVQLIANNRYD